MKGFLALLVRFYLAVTTLTSVTSGQTTQAAPVSACTFQLVNNKTFTDEVIQYFDQESYTVILEYTLNLTNVGANFDWVKKSSLDAFQPWRWYRTQGLASSQLLLIYYYYYGLLKPLMSVGLDQIRVDLEVFPKNCLNHLAPKDLEPLFRNYLLQDFKIDSKTAKHSFKYSDDVEICTARISNNDGWGKLLYRCCGFDSDNVMYCHDVYEDGWVWALRVFIVILTFLFCLYMPVLVPKGYRVYQYSYYPEKSNDLKFNIVITKNPANYRDRKSSIVIHSTYFSALKNFQASIKKLEADIISTVYVKKLALLIPEDKIFVENGATIKTLRALYNGLIRCKIQRAEPVKECCNTPACGTYCCLRCPRWSSLLRAVRTILVMLLLALPSVPFMYAMCADHLDYQILAKTFRDKGLKSTFDLYTGPVAGKVMVGIVTAMYILHGVVVIIDGASSQGMSQLYTDVLDQDTKKVRVRRRMQIVQSIIKKACLPVKRYGMIIVPFWILLVLLTPLYLIFMFFLNSPMVQVAIQVTKRIFVKARRLKDNPENTKKLYSRCEILLFFITALFVVVVITFGANFLVHILVLAIVMIVVEAELMYRILPVAFILLVYVRDSYTSIGKKFDSFLSTIFNYVNNKQLEDMRKECFKPSNCQENKIFHIPPDFYADHVDGDCTSLNLETVDRKEADPEELLPLFDIKDQQLRFQLKQFLVFLDKDDNMYISKKFMFHCCTVDCSGAPGTLAENYVNATMEFLKIGFFILFVFLVIMAYGTIYYISPTNHLFITLITGLIPLIIKNIFSGDSTAQMVSAANFKFQAQFKEKVESFQQNWILEDILLEQNPVSDDSDSILRNEELYRNDNEADLLIVNINDDFNQSFPVGVKSRSQENLKGRGQTKRPLLASTSYNTGDQETSFISATPKTNETKAAAHEKEAAASQTKVKTILADPRVVKTKPSKTDTHSYVV